MQRLGACRSAEDLGTKVERFSIVFGIHGQLGLLRHGFQLSVFAETVGSRISNGCFFAFEPVESKMIISGSAGTLLTSSKPV